MSPRLGFSQRIREERISIRVEDAAPNPVECICRVITYPEHLKVQQEPWLRLREVIFNNGFHAEFEEAYDIEVKNNSKDPTFTNHLPWQDLQQRCREEFAKGNFSSVEARI